MKSILDEENTFEYRAHESDEEDGTIPVEKLARDLVEKIGATNAIIMVTVPCNEKNHNHLPGEARPMGMIVGSNVELASMICQVMDRNKFTEELIRTALMAFDAVKEEQRGNGKN